MEQGIQRIDYRLLQGCCLEAERADILSVSLEGLRMALPEAYGGTITNLVDEIRRSARKLRDLADRSQMHFTRVPILLNYLDVILPCYSKTLRDMTDFYEDRTVSKDMRWRRMSTLFDLNGLETLRTRIIKLREAIGLPTPTNQIGPVLRPEVMLRPIPQDPTLHWAEQIFSLPLTSRTALKHIRPSTAYGPFQTWGQLNIPKQVKMLFRSHSQMGVKLWASLYFKTWEELVLFHCTFVSLKARNILTSRMSPREFKLGSEDRLFQAQILDDGFKHSLIVFRDLVTQGLRLQASVWDGELKNCPVWTAFVTHQSASLTWLVRKSDHRIWLKDVQLYVFCDQYHQQNQRKGSSAGAFEIDFVSEMGATRFIEAVQSQSDPSEASTDTMEAIEDAK
ncbi:hypothetical protein CSIM01_13039 [Colletotrichum simmondsii]|uniref:Uncharacterized protein n=1 Tax=Colletotrichum simmondsii TaxID=703756 RepID=A0A135TKL7_9PEZI|nr:hypothetical protein CSIM01_13039 [Colletotrichum simmondsii]